MRIAGGAGVQALQRGGKDQRVEGDGLCWRGRAAGGGRAAGRPLRQKGWYHFGTAFRERINR